MAARNAMVRKPTITLHMVTSLDGFIAKHDNNVDWFETGGDVYEAGVVEDHGAEALAAIDCWVMGSHTYELALQLGWVYGDTPTVVVTSRPLEPSRPSVELYSGDLEQLVRDVLAPRFKNVWLVGGAVLSQEFLRLGLVDEINLVIIPAMLGDGLRLFTNGLPERRWRLKNAIAYKSGLVELVYAIKPT
ncbi:MAG: dihydrofolate reductase family protein [Chloroflexota bacterium]